MPGKPVKVVYGTQRLFREMVRVLDQRMRKACALVVREVKQGKLNRGQKTARSGNRRVGLDPSQPGESPKVVTARLKQSITYRVERTETRLRGLVGTKVVYARALELGFVGRVRVKAHVRTLTRKFSTKGAKGRRAIGGSQKGEFTARVTLRVRVRAHGRWMNLKKRPYLKPVLEEQRADILNILRRG